jgi:hypothetical protein
MIRDGRQTAVQRIRYEVIPKARSSLACVDLKTG